MFMARENSEAFGGGVVPRAGGSLVGPARVARAMVASTGRIDAAVKCMMKVDLSRRG